MVTGAFAIYRAFERRLGLKISENSKHASDERLPGLVRGQRRPG
jgi:hypothetical protein